MQQSAGQDSTNFQAGGDINLYQPSITVTEVREIVHDAIRANMFDMRAEAQRLVEERISHFTDRYVERVAEEAPEVLAAAQDPDVQFAITQAGIGYARTGDDDMGDILIDLLADRAKAQSRSLLAVVINDAVSVAPRMTDAEIAILTLFWRLVHTVNHRVNSVPTLCEFIRAELVPLVSKIPRGDGSYRHLQALGCATIQITEISWADPWVKTYGGLFNKGFELEWIPEAVRSAVEPALIHCLRDPGRFQVNALNDQVIDTWADKYPEPALSEVKRLKQMYQMEGQEIADWLSEVDPAMGDLPSIWDSTPLKSLSLSAVGIAVAHANWRRLGHGDSPLSVWISEDVAAGG